MCLSPGKGTGVAGGDRRGGQRPRDTGLRVSRAARLTADKTQAAGRRRAKKWHDWAFVATVFLTNMQRPFPKRQAGRREAVVWADRSSGVRRDACPPGSVSSSQGLTLTAPAPSLAEKRTRRLLLEGGAPALQASL